MDPGLWGVDGGTKGASKLGSLAEAGNAPLPSEYWRRDRALFYYHCTVLPCPQQWFLLAVASGPRRRPRCTPEQEHADDEMKADTGPGTGTGPIPGTVTQVTSKGSDWGEGGGRCWGFCLCWGGVGLCVGVCASGRGLPLCWVCWAVVACGLFPGWGSTRALGAAQCLSFLCSALSALLHFACTPLKAVVHFGLGGQPWSSVV